ncbi:MAG: 4-alpha-glucanotransferase [Cyclobacteriaceae bacterium]
MKIIFSVVCHTRWGQEVYLVIDGEAHKLKPISDNSWSGSVNAEVSNELQYRYEIREDNQVDVEFGFRTIKVPDDDAVVEVSDCWRSSQSLDNVLYSAPFLKSIFARKPEKPQKEALFNNFSLNLRKVDVPAGCKIGVLGNLDELGAWDKNQVLLLSGNKFPQWSIEMCLTNIQSFEYKYVLCDETGKMLDWEQGDNRRFRGNTNSGRHIVHDEQVRFNDDLWRGAGIALPVFSLRTSNSAGVGEFTDIPVMIDWMASVGFKVFQVLPVNDTVANHSWWDSYPYAAISVHALHPVYANMQAIGPLKDKRKWNKLLLEAEAFNVREEFDYEGVMKMKSTFFKYSYDENRDEFLRSESLERFLAANKNWIYDYAAFSCFRDRFKTPDFNQWGEYSYLTDDEVLKFTGSDQEHYDDVAVHFYIQYHLDKQLKAATAYGRKHGVVLKGDIPIGIFRHSVEAWRKPALFHLDQQAGAPPDMFSTTGQNWGFPTYNWDEMEKDGYSWWIERLQKMSEYFDVIRLDHILGFFRIWQMPADQIQGLLGTFYPSLPLSHEEISSRGIHIDLDEYCEPVIHERQLERLHHRDLIEKFFLRKENGDWVIPEEMKSQQKVNQQIRRLIEEGKLAENVFELLQKELFKLQSEVLFIREPNSNLYHPRIDLHHTFRFAQLKDDLKHKLKDLHDYYYHHRHNDFWKENASKKLPVLRDASDMLVCGEDLGMVPQSVGPLMNELQILQLDVERYPKYHDQFKHLHYLSVKGTGNHDMLTLRQWWHEVREESEWVYHDLLGLNDHFPAHIDAHVAELLMKLHLESNSMWVIIPLQDLTTLSPELMRADMDAERINVPENPKNVWKYRFHMNLDELHKAEDFNEKVRRLIVESGR